MQALAISLFLLTSAYADDELLILLDRIAEQEKELDYLQEFSRAIIINKQLELEELKQQKEALEWGNIGWIAKKENENVKESNIAENNKEDAEDKK